MYTISVVFFYKPACLQKKFYMGIFLRQDLHVWADTVSLQMNTISSHDQFKPILIKIRIRENFVVSYNRC